MLFTRTSLISGVTNTLDLAVTPEQFADYEAGTLVQDAFFNLSADEREFIITGIMPGDFPNED